MLLELIVELIHQRVLISKVTGLLSVRINVSIVRLFLHYPNVWLLLQNPKHIPADYLKQQPWKQHVLEPNHKNNNVTLNTADFKTQGSRRWGLLPFFNPAFLQPYVNSFFKHHASDCSRAALRGKWQAVLRSMTYRENLERKGNMFLIFLCVVLPCLLAPCQAYVIFQHVYIGMGIGTESHPLYIHKTVSMFFDTNDLFKIKIWLST